jgi:hypothetical protein
MEPNKETSQELSSLASKYLNMPSLSAHIYTCAFDKEMREQLATDVKCLAACVLGQDEHHG